jgi:flagellar hook-associated protein 1 FlgK
MPGLFHILNVGADSLQTSRQGVDTTGHNIANAQVEGYSRQKVNVSQRDPLFNGNIPIGNGVYVGSITRAHDKFIEHQINIHNQDKGRSTAYYEGMKGVELIFSPELNATVPDEISQFFDQLETLSTFPEDSVVRKSVLESARDVCQAFKRNDTELKIQRFGINEKIQHTTSEVSGQLAAIADLNIKIQASEAGEPQQACDYRDQRDKLLREISQKLDIHYYEDQYGMLMVRGPGQVTLVDGAHSSVVDVVRSNENHGLFDITITDWEQKKSRNVTSMIGSGTLAGLLEVRDDTIGDLLEKNNNLAYELASNVNAIHREGFGLKSYAESTGRNFFSPLGSLENAAQEIYIDDVILENLDAISAGSTPMAPGDNVNLNRIIKLKDAKLFGDEKVTFNEYYSSFAGGLGLDVLRAEHVDEINKVMLEDLTRRREAVAGVSLDEEATNMIKWQACFTASSKVITTCDEMLETVLSLKR